MKDNDKITVSGVAYKIKDWLVILSALVGIFMWITKYADMPKRLDTVENKQEIMNADIIEMKSGIKYLVRTVDGVGRSHPA